MPGGEARGGRCHDARRSTPNASFVVLNRCTRAIRVSLRAAEMLRSRLPRAAQHWSLVATTYLAVDPGALVGLPGDLYEDPFVFPWRTGPLSPTVNVNTELRHDELDQYTFILRAVSLTIAIYSPAGDAPCLRCRLICFQAVGGCGGVLWNLVVSSKPSWRTRYLAGRARH